MILKRKKGVLKMSVYSERLRSVTLPLQQGGLTKFRGAERWIGESGVSGESPGLELVSVESKCEVSALSRLRTELLSHLALLFSCNHS